MGTNLFAAQSNIIPEQKVTRLIQVDRYEDHFSWTCKSCKHIETLSVLNSYKKERSSRSLETELRGMAREHRCEE